MQRLANLLQQWATPSLSASYFAASARNVQAAAVRLTGADRKRVERLMRIAVENIRQIRTLVGIASGMLDGEGDGDPPEGIAARVRTPPSTDKTVMGNPRPAAPGST